MANCPNCGCKVEIDAELRDVIKETEDMLDFWYIRYRAGMPAILSEFDFKSLANKLKKAREE